MSIPTLVSDFVTTFWTPIFVVIFLGIVAYALWPKNRDRFDAAARLPLED
jgi:cytochrome c oxidase cbb3-type subunit IV